VLTETPQDPVAHLRAQLDGWRRLAGVFATR
jgi:hypothetical protein